MSSHNPDCDGSDYTCKGPKEVRVLPGSGGSNLIVCRSCYEHEKNFRMRRLIDEEPADKTFPKWESLKACGP